MRPVPAEAFSALDESAVGARVGRLFEEHARMVHAICRLLLRDSFEAEDATQQTFLSAHRSLLKGAVVEDPAAWIASIARNECFSRLRRARPELVPLFDGDHQTESDLADLVDQRDEIAALSEALEGLPPAQRRAVVLREFYGLSYDEVSVALGVSGPAVESLLFKGRKRLQERLRPLHTARGLAVLPVAIREGLANAIPGFSNGAAGSAAGAAGAGISAKLLTGSAAAKLAAMVVAAGIGTVAITHEAAKLPLLSSKPTHHAVVPSAPGRQSGSATAPTAASTQPAVSSHTGTFSGTLLRSGAGTSATSDTREGHEGDSSSDDGGTGIESSRAGEDQSGASKSVVPSADDGTSTGSGESDQSDDGTGSRHGTGSISPAGASSSVGSIVPTTSSSPVPTGSGGGDSFRGSESSSPGAGNRNHGSSSSDGGDSGQSGSDDGGGSDG